MVVEGLRARTNRRKELPGWGHQFERATEGRRTAWGRAWIKTMCVCVCASLCGFELGAGGWGQEGGEATGLGRVDQEEQRKQWKGWSEQYSVIPGRVSCVSLSSTVCARCGWDGRALCAVLGGFVRVYVCVCGERGWW